MTTETVAQKTSIDMDCCPECGCRRIETDYDKGERVCSQCGCVLEDNFFDLRPEPTYEGKDRTHVGAPMSSMLHDGGLSTTISRSWRDGNGNRLDRKAFQKYNRLSKIHQRSRMSNAFEKGLAMAFGEIKKMCTLLSVPEKVQENTCLLYKKAMRKGLIRGRSVRLIAAACIYLSCRICKVPRTLKEVSGPLKINKTELNRAYNFVSRSLKLKACFVKPQDLVPRFCTMLGLSPSTQAKVMEIISLYEKSGMDSGKNPAGIAAGAIYVSTMICNERRTQRAVASMTIVTEVTIRNRTEEMMSLLS